MFEIGYETYRRPHEAWTFTRLFLFEGTREEAQQIANHLSPYDWLRRPVWRGR